MHFVKYQGTGNDFIMVDNRQGIFDPSDIKTVTKWCDRKFGIGADGLILIQHAEGYDFEMIYFNSDGSQSLCGNGSRCAVNFAKELGIIGDKTFFLAIDGSHEAKIENGIVHLKMNNVTQIEHSASYDFINTGSPHWVHLVNDVTTFPVVDEGRKIRYNERFKEKGTNVNFVQKLPVNQIFVRTYERGVEDETLSCGTGVTACALAASAWGYQSPVAIKVLGGNLQVSFEGNLTDGFTNVWLVGPAVRVFEGNVAL